MERASVFIRAIGEGTDVVQKEMYTLQDRGGREIALRPEGTAGVMRFVAAGGPERAEARLYYLGPMFRAERPQAGRKRQFHQIGVEALGAPSPAADAECMALQVHLLQELGLADFTLHVNTRGLPEDRPRVVAGLRERLTPRIGELCEDCRRRLDANPLRILDCKQAACRAIAESLPPVSEFMGEGSRAYLAAVVRLLARLEIPARVNPLLVRGLDYYVHTVWELTHPALGAQDALAGGGRYRMETGGRTLDGVGFAIGMERLVMALQAAGPAPADASARPRVWLAAAGEAQVEALLSLLQALRRHGVAAGMDLAGRSMKAQMRAAHRSGAPGVVIRGEAEAARDVYLLKDMATGRQQEIDLAGLMRLFTAP
jgi:histidyl-tRNA synthetase